jgi:hypothetical protein
MTIIIIIIIIIYLAPSRGAAFAATPLSPNKELPPRCLVRLVDLGPLRDLPDIFEPDDLYDFLASFKTCLKERPRLFLIVKFT